jgi:cytochrome P450
VRANFVVQSISSALAVFIILAMNPEVQRKGQALIDDVVGADRIPIFNDLERLPYIQAFVKELGRWHSAVPLGELWRVSGAGQLRTV